MGLFKKIATALAKTRDAFRKKMDYLFSGGELSDEFYEELEDILISCDVGVETSVKITELLQVEVHKNKVRKASDARELLKKILINILNDVKPQTELKFPLVVSVIGVNGVGKTTSIGKLAHFFKLQKKDVTLVAGDTFRAAAADQLTEWANRNKVKIIKHAEGADAGAVVFDGVSSAKAKGTDVLIIDTAGRLHTKTNLMEELAKLDRIISREFPEVNRLTLIVLDATTGQNALAQINHFNNYMKIDGIFLTKLDGTAKGGVVLAIAKEYEKPVMFVGLGESIDDLELFNAEDFVNNLF